MSTPDVIVVGGGVVGASCAYFLSTDGLRVTLVERGGIASGTSGACQSNVGAGVGTESFHDFFMAAVDTYRELTDRGFDLGYQAHGHLIVAETEADMSCLRASVAKLCNRGVACEILSPNACQQVEPNVSTELAGAALFPNGAQVSPMSVAIELVDAAARNGAKIFTGTRVEGIDIQGGRFRAVDTSTGRIEGGRLVIAAGAWSARVGQLAGLRVPVWPLKGQVVVVEPAPGLLQHTIIDLAFETALGEGSGLSVGEAPDRDECLIGTVVQPLPTGELLVGGSREYRGFNRDVTPRTIAQISHRAIQFVPTLGRQCAIRAYAGLRPWTPDGRPLIGPCDAIEGVYLAIGPVGSITGGPITGRTIADVIASRPPRAWLSAVSPDRLGASLYEA